MMENKDFAPINLHVRKILQKNADVRCLIWILLLFQTRMFLQSHCQRVLVKHSRPALAKCLLLCNMVEFRTDVLSAPLRWMKSVRFILMNIPIVAHVAMEAGNVLNSLRLRIPSIVNHRRYVNLVRMMAKLTQKLDVCPITTVHLPMANLKTLSNAFALTLILGLQRRKYKHLYATQTLIRIVSTQLVQRHPFV